MELLSNNFYGVISQFTITPFFLVMKWTWLGRYKILHATIRRRFLMKKRCMKKCNFYVLLPAHLKALLYTFLLKNQYKNWKQKFARSIYFYTKICSIYTKNLTWELFVAVWNLLCTGFLVVMSLSWNFLSWAKSSYKA